MPVDTVEEVPEKNDDNNNTTEEDEDAMPDADYLNQAEAVLSNDFRRVDILLNVHQTWLLLPWRFLSQVYEKYVDILIGNTLDQGSF